VGNNLRTTKHKSICPVIARPARMNDMIYDNVKAAGDTFPVYKTLARKIGLEESIFLCRLIWWQKSPDEWISKDRKQLEYETSLSRKQQERARKSLRASGLLEEKEDRLAHKKFFRPIESAINALYFPDLPEGPKGAAGNAPFSPSTNDNHLKGITKDSAAVAAAPLGEASSGDSEQARKAEHTAFMALWYEAFQIQFDRAYVGQGALDGKPLKTVLAASKMQAKDLMSIATKAWAKRGRDFFHCEAAVTIKYFCEHINQILSELEKRKPGDLPAPRIKAKSPPPGLLPVSDQPTPGYDKGGNEISMAEWERLYPLWNYYEVDTLEPCAARPNVGSKI